MPKIIVTSRYIKSGSHGKISNYVKYIATREGVAISENRRELDREVFMNYLDSRPQSHGLFSGTDEPIVLDRAAKEVANHTGTVWTHIVSLRRDDAERMGYNNLEAWRDLVRRHISDIAEAQKIAPENIRWYAAFHNKETNPHVHIVAYSADGKQGFLTEKGIEKIRSAFANDIYKDELQNLYQQQTLVRDNLRSEAESVMKNLLAELEKGDFENPHLEELVLKLQSQLRGSKGKKVYGYLQPSVKTTVDEIVAELVKNPLLKKMYDEWCSLEQQKYETYTSTVQKFPPLEANKAFKPIKNAVIRAVLDMQLPTSEPNISSQELFAIDSTQLQNNSQSSIQKTVLAMLSFFGKLISDDYNRSSRGLKLRTEHKLKAAIRRKKQALGLKENPLENPQFKEG
ncbi:MAG: MobP3 family relaxase [Oscillospiraceae bacterium]